MTMEQINPSIHPLLLIPIMVAVARLCFPNVISVLCEHKYLASFKLLLLIMKIKKVEWDNFSAAKSLLEKIEILLKIGWKLGGLQWFRKT